MAKKAPTAKPGIEINIMEGGVVRASKIAMTPEANDAIISIRTFDFVATNLHDVINNSISHFLS
jgi:hypothetical protein